MGIREDVFSTCSQLTTLRGPGASSCPSSLNLKKLNAVKQHLISLGQRMSQRASSHKEEIPTSPSHAVPLPSPSSNISSSENSYEVHNEPLPHHPSPPHPLAPPWCQQLTFGRGVQTLSSAGTRGGALQSRGSLCLIRAYFFISFFW